VGQLTAGSGRNVVPSEARLVIETRGATVELDAYMYARAVRVLESAAAMYGCELDIVAMGAAQDAASDPELAARVARVARRLGGFAVVDAERGGGSEDFTTMMRRVQSRGGLATYIGLGTDVGGGGHHTARFDIDERALPLGVMLLAGAAADVLLTPGQTYRSSA
jgi:aminobenzoyl-glutamate utilization protein A